MSLGVLRAGALGLFLGGSLAWIGFNSWDAVHAMFLFSDLRLFFTFMAGVTILGVAWQFFGRTGVDVSSSPRPIHKGTLLGGALFGAGWAISGACPAIALVQLGDGQYAAIFTLLGILIGNYGYATVQERWLHWAKVSCADD